MGLSSSSKNSGRPTTGRRGVSVSSSSARASGNPTPNATSTTTLNRQSAIGNRQALRISPVQAVFVAAAQALLPEVSALLAQDARCRTLQVLLRVFARHLRQLFLIRHRRQGSRSRGTLVAFLSIPG